MNNGQKVTTRRIEELKAVVEMRRQEHAESSARLDRAHADLFAAERELKRNAKPTPAMLVLLRQMADGVAIRRNSWNYNYYSETGETDYKSASVRESVFRGLKEREAIEVVTVDGKPQARWLISEHGREIVKANTTT